MRKLIFSSLCAVSLAACAQPGEQGYAPPGAVGLNKTTGGALIGAGLGGLAGSQIGHGSGTVAATAIGVILGGLVGGSVGASLDRADQAAMQQSTQQALERGPSGQPVEWRNPDSGHYGEIIPARAYQQNNTYCREYQQTVVIGGQTQQAYGKACRQPDGTWQIQNS
jgi:surface antigen